MKNVLLKLVLFLSIAIVITACEKENYSINNETNIENVNKGTSSYVSIEDVPFLKPKIEKFKNKITSRGIDSLEFDTEHIVEFLQSNGFKSYSIIVKKNENSDEYYFENLHIVKDQNDIYNSFFVRYVPEKIGKVDFSNYTGKMEFYDEDKIPLSTLFIENSLLKLIDPVVPTDGGENSGSGDGDPNCSCNSGGSSIFSYFIGWLSDVYHNFVTYLGNLQPGSSGPLGYVEVALTGTNGTMPNPLSGTTSGPGIIFVPNVPALTTIQKANQIYQWLNIEDTSIRSWLKQNQVYTDEIYSLIFEGNDSQNISTNFIQQAINNIRHGGEVDFIRKIIEKPSFTNTKTKCIYNKLRLNNSNFFSTMLSKFNTDTGKDLSFEIANIPNGDWGKVIKDPNNSNNYILTISSTVENGTNLMKITTLCHEMIHAYMFTTLEDEGVLTFDSYGNPILNVTCMNNINYNSVNLSGLSMIDKFNALICAMNQNGTLTLEWTHDIFNEPIFSISTYRQNLENFLILNNDWTNEDPNFKNEAISIFGTNWIQEVSKATSWIGLEGTVEYSNYINLYSSDFAKFLYIQNIRNKIATAKTTCL